MRARLVRWLVAFGAALLAGWLGAVVAPGAGALARECDGQQILQPGHCAGDEIDGPERQLAALINAYRAERGLPAIALSPALSVVANRHVRDMAMNSRRLTHDWSNCPMARSWACMWKAPQVLRTGYTGAGYENAWGGSTSAGPIDVAAVLHAWKENGDGPHDDVILNKKAWQKRTWRALGIGIHGGFAVMWVGEEADVMVSAAAPAAEGPIALRNRVTGPARCLDIVNDGKNDQVHMAPCGDHSGQQWLVERLKGGPYVRLRTRFTGPDRCLEIVNDSRNNNLARMAPCGNRAGQQWSIEPVPGPGYNTWPTTNLTGPENCLAVIAAARRERVGMKPCPDGSPGEPWSLAPMSTRLPG